MSAAQHQAMAMNEERVAKSHVQQYEPGARTEVERCARGGVGAIPLGGYEGACWTSVRNPTAEHIDQAEKHRKMAADHRAASAALQDAEARACTGLSPDDVSTSPFSHPADIASVEPLFAARPYGRTTNIEGAVINFRAVPGMTTQWLQRLINCHLARNAALGHEVSEMPSCPLVPKGVGATVAATDTGFAVSVHADDAGTALEVLRRARLLVPEDARETPRSSR